MPNTAYESTGYESMTLGHLCGHLVGRACWLDALVLANARMPLLRELVLARIRQVRGKQRARQDPRRGTGCAQGPGGHSAGGGGGEEIRVPPPRLISTV